MSKKRLSLFTVEEIGAVIKPSLETMIEGSLKDLKTGEITHVNDSEIILNKFKIEVSDEDFIPYDPYSAGWRKGLTIGFVIGLVALPLGYAVLNWAANQWRDKNALAIATKPVVTSKKPILFKSPPLKVSQPTVTMPRPLPTSELTDDLNDTLSPSGLPMSRPNQPPELDDADFEN